MEIEVSCCYCNEKSSVDLKINACHCGMYTFQEDGIDGCKCGNFLCENCVYTITKHSNCPKCEDKQCNRYKRKIEDEEKGIKNEKDE